MAQQTYYVNCPKCASIIEVVNPKPDVEVSSVYATSDHVSIIDTKPHFWFSIKCPQCSELIWIRWWYKY